LRILFISNYYPPYEVGGYEQLCRDVAMRLTERGHQVQILTSDRGVRQAGFSPNPNIHRLLRFVPDYDARLSAGLQFFLTRRRDEAHNLQSMRHVLQQFDPDAIFTWNLYGLPKAIALEAEAAPRAGIAYWLAGESPAEPDEFEQYWRRGARNPIVRPFKSMVAALALALLHAERKPARPQLQHVAVVSEFIRQQGITRGVLPEHTQVIYNGVELQVFQRPARTAADGALTLLQAGRVSIDKGVHTTIEAIGRLTKECGTSNIRLIVAGSGPQEYAASLHHIAAQYGITDKVSFLGWLPRDKMPQVMAQCEVLVLPTENQEPFARVVLEAMASGLTVISTLTGGSGEVVQQGVTGLTFPPGDSAALAQQIQRLATDSQLRLRLAIAAQQLVLERFSLDRMVDSCERLLQEACKDKTL
jgi:glycosyltransferase involved in cell wall biosynthesis